MSDSKSNWQKHKNSVIVCFFITIIAFVSCLFFIGEETYTESKQVYSIEVLQCLSSNPINSFFGYSDSVNSKHEIKITYRQDEPDKISYSYNNILSSEEDAQHVDAVLHAKYNNYMGEHKLNLSTLGPIFMVVENKFKINFYTKFSNINAINGVVFFLSPEEVVNVANNSIGKTKELYTSKNFVCSIINNNEEEDEKE